MTTASRRLGLGRLVGGLLLVVVGVLWLIEEFTDLDLPWTTLLPLILIVIGLALMYGSATGPHTGLVALGIVVTVIVVLSSAADVLFDVPFSGGVGDNAVTPIALEDEYRWAVGSMTVDLTDAALDGREIQVSVGLGELIVIVPNGAVVQVSAAAGIGEVIVFGETQSGISPEVNPPPPAGSPAIVITARVGIGKVEVRRG
ncbi:MAG: hypothetical protein A2135_02050 [Actinobacteria bacterium RBG_16_67_15]|nr:MAG: hypothetical protein A2135_02050 [Actinobacteria bacterium RBG_16_67_15]